MKRTLAVCVAAAALWSCSSGDNGTGPSELDVSGVWTASLSGTVYNNEDGTGQTTTLELTLQQSGTTVTGSERIDDTLGRSATISVTGTFVGQTLTVASPDVDPQCGGRVATGVGKVTSTTSGSKVMLVFAAGAAGTCPALSSALEYTKR